MSSVPTAFATVLNLAGVGAGAAAASPAGWFNSPLLTPMPTATPTASADTIVTVLFIAVPSLPDDRPERTPGGVLAEGNFTRLWLGRPWARNRARNSKAASRTSRSKSDQSNRNKALVGQSDHRGGFGAGLPFARCGAAGLQLRG